MDNLWVYLPTVLLLLIGVIISYLLGSVNFAIIITKLFKKGDIRDYGSGNAGMTNVLRTVGKSAAAITLLGDFSKGIISVFIMRLLLSFALGVPFGTPYPPLILGDYIAVYGALIGHVFPVFYHFKGGKGILVSFGAVMILSPIAGVICLAGFLITVVISKYISLGSIVAAVIFPLVIVSLNIIEYNTVTYELLLALPVAAMIIFMHHANIKRLLSHTESKVSFKKKG